MNFLKRLFGSKRTESQPASEVENFVPLPELKVLKRMSSNGTCESLDVEFAESDALERVLKARGYSIGSRAVSGGMTTTGGYNVMKLFVIRNELLVAEIKELRASSGRLKPADLGKTTNEAWREMVRVVFECGQQSSTGP